MGHFISIVNHDETKEDNFPFQNRKIIYTKICFVAKATQAITVIPNLVSQTFCVT